MKWKPEVKNAVLIGGLCAVAYMAVYLARNILSAVSPQMEEIGAIRTEQLGYLSSVFFITYAIGQLLNGIIGDMVKAKYMISLGLALAGICNIIFAVYSAVPAVSYLAYGLTGLFLAMIYGPMTKVIAENTEPKYATRCSLGNNFSSFLGSPLAGVMAAVFAWQTAFHISSVVLLITALLCFFTFQRLEAKGIVRYNQYHKPKESHGLMGSVRLLVRHRIIRFSLISILTGVIRITVVFWLPSYISGYLGYSADRSAILYTVATLFISANAFFAVFLYERLRYNMDLTILISFITAALSFLLTYFMHQPVLNIICMVMGVFASNCAASMLWGRYCPGLRDTGMVSGATGFLDFLNYFAAAISSVLFANAVDTIGWDWLILIWFGLMVIGVAVALPFGKPKGDIAEPVV